jgi:putative addiction module killer protein
MNEVRQTEYFAKWLEGLRDRLAKSKVLVRIDRLRVGLVGDARPVGGGVSELRIDSGPGYRLYFVRRGRELFILLVGGDKGSQNRDIRRAIEMASRL